jgi:hypothetical protein
MKKSSQIFIFVIVFTVSILAINNLLFSLVWDCRCSDEYWAEMNCEQVCSDRGGCAFFLLDEATCYCNSSEGCNCVYHMYCVDNSRIHLTHTRPSCSDCTSYPEP